MHARTYDGVNLIAQDRDGSLEQEYIHHERGIDKPWALIDHSGASADHYYYHADRLGTIRVLTHTDTTVAQTYDYTAFGQTTVGTPGGLDQPFRVDVNQSGGRRRSRHISEESSGAVNRVDQVCGAVAHCALLGQAQCSHVGSWQSSTFTLITSRIRCSTSPAARFPPTVAQATSPTSTLVSRR